ncbi:hypothetical protein DUNSADRAFT_6858 [Dunaliella salina]|uniref:Uncharacterized protein n=1 Tax=Dunaliella salina TaxID=3046 RepID=A0ABQ7GMI8_DUNSA|nr:hypothetical protein DUNSADRAFT_6858 [Dunaliella salina]|eukprot:KAF5835824.1 hypothetical protein DUNSADRAFT_6858 [Dunaliella salina]
MTDCLSRSSAKSSPVTDITSRTSAKSMPITEHTSRTSCKSAALERSSNPSSWPEDSGNEESLKRGEEGPVSSEEGGEQRTSTGGQGNDAVGVGGSPWEFDFVPLGERPIKGKGMVSTFLVKVGKWMEAYETYMQQQAAQRASLRTPEGLNTFRAGQACGYSDGYQDGFTACSILVDAKAGLCRDSLLSKRFTPTRHPASDICRFGTRSSLGSKDGAPRQVRAVHSSPVSPRTSRRASLSEYPLPLHALQPQAAAAVAAAASQAASEAPATSGQPLGQHAPHMQVCTSTDEHTLQQQQALLEQANSSKLASSQAQAPATQHAPFTGAPAHAASLMAEPCQPASCQGRGAHPPMPARTHTPSHAHPQLHVGSSQHEDRGDASEVTHVQGVQPPSAHVNWRTLGAGGGALPMCRHEPPGNRSAPLPVVAGHGSAGLAGHRCSLELGPDVRRHLIVGASSSTSAATSGSRPTLQSTQRRPSTPQSSGGSAAAVDCGCGAAGTGANLVLPLRLQHHQHSPPSTGGLSEGLGNLRRTLAAVSCGGFPQTQGDWEPPVPGSAFATSPAAEAAAAAAVEQARGGATAPHDTVTSLRSRSSSMGAHIDGSASLAEWGLLPEGSGLAASQSRAHHAAGSISAAQLRSPSQSLSHQAGALARNLPLRFRSHSQAGGMLARSGLHHSYGQIPTRLAASSTAYGKAASSEPLPPVPKARQDRRSLPMNLCSSSSLSSPQGDSHCGSFRLMGDGRLLGPFFHTQTGRSSCSSSSQSSTQQHLAVFPEQEEQQQQQQQQQRWWRRQQEEQQQHEQLRQQQQQRQQPDQQQQNSQSRWQQQSDSSEAGSPHAQGPATSGSQGLSKPSTPALHSRAQERALPRVSSTPPKSENPLSKAVRRLSSKLKLDKGHR